MGTARASTDDSQPQGLEGWQADGDDGELDFEGSDDNYFPDYVRKVWRVVQLDKRDESEAGDQDSASTEADDGENGNFAAHRHLEVPDRADREYQDVEICEYVLGPS